MSHGSITDLSTTDSSIIKNNKFSLIIIKTLKNHFQSLYFNSSINIIVVKGSGKPLPLKTCFLGTWSKFT